MSKKEKRSLSDKLLNPSWQTYFILGGLLIIWSIVIWVVFFGAFNIATDTTAQAGFILLGCISTGILLILVAIIDKLL